MQGPTGYFCSDACRKNHEAFIERAKQLDDMKGRLNFDRLIRNTFMIVVIVLIGSMVAHYFGYNIPVLSGIFEGRVPRAN